MVNRLAVDGAQIIERQPVGFDRARAAEFLVGGGPGSGADMPDLADSLGPCFAWFAQNTPWRSRTRLEPAEPGLFLVNQRGRRPASQSPCRRYGSYRRVRSRTPEHLPDRARTAPWCGPSNGLPWCGRRGAPGEMLLDQGGQALAVDGLAGIVVAACRKAFFAILGHGVRGQRDDDATVAFPP